MKRSTRRLARRQTTEEKLMSGWKRLGAVISILWVIGLPIYLIIVEGQKREAGFDACLSRPFFEGQYRFCADNRKNALEVSGREFRDVLWFGNESGNNRGYVGSWIYWGGAVLFPVVMLWIVGGIVIGTARWVWRGFAYQRSKTRA